MFQIVDLMERFKDLMHKVFSGKLPVDSRIYSSMDIVEEAMSKTRERKFDEAIDIYLKICENDKKVYPAIIDFLFEPFLCTSHIEFAYEVIAYAELLAKKCWGSLNNNKQWIQEKRRIALEKYISDFSNYTIKSYSSKLSEKDKEKYVEKSKEKIEKLISLILEISYAGLSKYKWVIIGFTTHFNVYDIDYSIERCLSLYKVLRANHVICDDQNIDNGVLRLFENINEDGKKYVLYTIYYNTEKIKILTYTKKKDRIIFGTYYIKNWLKDPIEWDILEEKDGKALIITHDIIYAKCFDEDSNLYKNSSIRKWLNEDFYNIAFNEAAKRTIESTRINIENDGETYEFINQSTDSDVLNDKLFLLSIEELYNYYPLCDIKKRQASATDYAKYLGIKIYENNNSSWWLRTNYKRIAYCVLSSGGVNVCPESKDGSIGIRPACWITL